jgi:aspartyl-tRNA(Asn)/glutamyl-tRNA(Gln) amidotransferase subunit A
MVAGMSDTDLLFTPAAKAAALIRAKKLSPVEYLDTVLEAVDKANPKLNCFRAVMVADARRDAKKAEEAIMRGDPLGPLYGVPISVKDLVDVKGVPTRHGSAIFDGNPPAAADDILVKRLRDAGAIIFAKATTPEFGNKGLTDGPSFGITRNPWNLGRTPGGSSGGGAAAVAAGLGPLSLGTDGAGSVRGPASCSGLVGLKPTLGVVPYDTTRDAFGNNIYAGPLSRTITDAAIMHSVMAGPSEKDPWALSSAGQRPLSPKLSGEDLSGVRIGYVELCANPRIAGDVRTNTRAALAAWEAMGAEVEEVTEKIDWIEYEGRVLYQAGFSVSFAQYLSKWQNQMDPVTLAFMQRGDKFTLADFRNAQFARTVLFRKIQTLFERCDFIVTPTNARTALDVTHDAANDDVIIDGVKCGITRQGWTSYQYPFNLTGHPAMAVPSGFGTDGLPTSVQIVGKWQAETDVLRLGALLERARPWAQHRPEKFLTA